MSLLSEALSEAEYVDDDGIRVWAGVTSIAFALLLLVYALAIFPPPPRQWPRKRPLCGLLPWCLISRALGYGLIDWHTGNLTPFPAYVLERHELIAVFWGDFTVSTRQQRVMCLLMNISATFSLGMVMTGADGIVEGLFLDQLWVYVFIFGFQFLVGIALRLSSLGAKEHGRVNHFMRLGSAWCLVSLAAALAFANVVNDTCSWCVTTRYLELVAIAELSAWTLVQPMQLLLLWLVGFCLHGVSIDYLRLDQLVNAQLVVHRAVERRAHLKAEGLVVARVFESRRGQGRGGLGRVHGAAEGA